MIFTALLNPARLTNKDPRENAASILFHRAITEAIPARDGDAAETRTEETFADAWQSLGEYLNSW